MEKKEGVLLAACVSEILEVPLKLWHPSTLEELWKLGSGAVLCPPHENSVELGADTRLLGRSLRSPCDALAAKPMEGGSWPQGAAGWVSPPALPWWRLFRGSSCCRVGTGEEAQLVWSSWETGQGLGDQRDRGTLQLVPDFG